MNHTIDKDFEILLHDSDHHGRVRLARLCDYLQATGDFHSRDLGTSMDHLAEENRTWVYARFRIEMERYPQCYEKVTVTTWRSRMDGALAYREFEIKDNAGSCLGAATSAVALIDLSTRKPVAIPLEFAGQFSDLPGSALGGAFSRLPECDETSPQKIFPVMMRDIDRNGHVNNTSYITWLLESSPENLLQEGTCRALEIHYRAEAHYGFDVKACAMKEENSTGGILIRHTLRQGEKTTTLARSQWSPEP